MHFTHFCVLFPVKGASWSSSLTHVRALIRALISLSFLLSFQLSFSCSFPLFLLGCHRSLCYCSPATSLRLRACHSFWDSYCKCSVPFVPTVTPHLSPSYYLCFCKSRVLLSRALSLSKCTHLVLFLSSSFQKPAPSPCAYCIGRPRFLPIVSSLFGLSPSLNSRRLAHFSRFIPLHFISLVPFASQTPVAPP